MRSLDDILTQLRALQPDLRRRYPIRSMGVFGSYVRGEQRDDSDVDVLVELGDGVDLIAYAGLATGTQRRLGRARRSGRTRSPAPAPCGTSAVRGRPPVKRDPAACLADMLDYARDAQAFVAGIDFEAFATDIIASRGGYNRIGLHHFFNGKRGNC